SNIPSSPSSALIAGKSENSMTRSGSLTCRSQPLTTCATWARSPAMLSGLAVGARRACSADRPRAVTRSGAHWWASRLRAASVSDVTEGAKKGMVSPVRRPPSSAERNGRSVPSQPSSTRLRTYTVLIGERSQAISGEGRVRGDGNAGQCQAAVAAERLRLRTDLFSRRTRRRLRGHRAHDQASHRRTPGPGLHHRLRAGNGRRLPRGGTDDAAAAPTRFG